MTRKQQALVNEALGAGRIVEAYEMLFRMVVNREPRAGLAQWALDEGISVEEWYALVRAIDYKIKLEAR